MLASLIPKLRTRFGDSAAECGASSTVVEACQSMSTDLLRDVLDEARLEYSQYNPIEEVLTINSVSNSAPSFNLPYEPFAITGVYTFDEYSFGAIEIPNILSRQYLANYYADPALARVDAMHFDYGNPEATFIRHGKNIRITSPLSAASKVEVHVHRMRSWAEMPEWSEPVLIKLGLIKLIDQTTTASGGLLRIPTPTGYFESDGGRVMQNLRTKLADEVFRIIQPNTHGIMQG